MPSISEKFGSLSVSITGINSLNALIPILSSISSKNLTTFSELGFLIKSKIGNCKLGKNADFRGLCQTCPSYRKLAGAKPARTDLRKKKLNKIIKKESREY